MIIDTTLSSIEKKIQNIENDLNFCEFSFGPKTFTTNESEIYSFVIEGKVGNFDRNVNSFEQPEIVWKSNESFRL